MELSETLATDCVPSSLFLCFCFLNLFLFLANNLPLIAHLYCQKVFLTPPHYLDSLPEITDKMAAVVVCCLGTEYLKMAGALQ